MCTHTTRNVPCALCMHGVHTMHTRVHVRVCVCACVRVRVRTACAHVAMVWCAHVTMACTVQCGDMERGT